MRWLSQPEDSLHVELMDALAAHTERTADSSEGLGWGVVKTVMSNDDVA
jgi:hypothetical protein